MMIARFARAVVRLIARIGSPKDRANHVSFLDDIFEHQTQSSLADHTRASVQHLFAVVTSREPASMRIVLGAALMWVGLAGVALAPTASLVVDDPVRGVVAQGAHLLGAAGIAASFVSSNTRARTVFVWCGIVPTLVGQLCNLTVSFPYVDDIVSIGDRLLWAGEALGAVAAVTLLGTHSRRNQPGVQASWRALCASFFLVLGSHCIYGLAFARAGEALWVVLICTVIGGNMAFTSGVSRHRPTWWASAA